jgi:hypothetical protein
MSLVEVVALARRDVGVVVVAVTAAARALGEMLVVIGIAARRATPAAAFTAGRGHAGVATDRRFAGVGRLSSHRFSDAGGTGHWAAIRHGLG